MATSRVEIRLDAQRRRKLDELSEARGVAVSTLVRDLIDAAYEDRDRTRRLEAVKRLISLNGEDMPDPATLKQQILSKYDDPFPPDLP